MHLKDELFAALQFPMREKILPGLESTPGSPSLSDSMGRLEKRRGIEIRKEKEAKRAKPCSSPGVPSIMNTLLASGLGWVISSQEQHHPQPQDQQKHRLREPTPENYRHRNPIQSVSIVEIANLYAYPRI